MEKNNFRFTSLYGGMSDSNQESSPDVLANYIAKLLQLRTDIKMFHWQTKSFAYHKISDELLGSIDDLTDKLVEAICGLTNSRPNILPGSTIRISNLVDKKNFIDVLKQANTFLREPNTLLSSTEIANIRDEILGSIDKALYLLSFD